MNASRTNLRPFRRFPAWTLLFLMAWLAGHQAMPLVAASAERPSVDLSGEWEFCLDPKDVGKDERWFATDRAFPRRVRVPGAWNAQGIGFENEADLLAYRPVAQRESIAGPGTETNKLYHVFPGPGWYRRTVVIPAAWESQRLWLSFGGVHRTAEVWVNGEWVGSHVGYVVPFRLEITGKVRAGQAATIVARVDGRRNAEVDPLMGCMDTVDFLFVQWGGMHRGVSLEATRERWIENVFVVPKLSEASAEVRVELSPADAETRNGRYEILVEAVDQDGRKVGGGPKSVTVEGQATPHVLTLAIPEPRRWSPDTPHLYEARVSLVRDGIHVDGEVTRFGMREFQVRDGRFVLNGNPVFLRGYGDDCIYPDTIAPPASREEYRRRFQVVKDYGFNYVRHHSWCPPKEYFDVADEMGVMVQPEFPQAYKWELPKTETTRALARQLWREMIRTHRNHPSIVTWCMGNELYDGFPDAPAMYRDAKELDPTRLVIDSDGISRQPRDTLDFWVWQFGESALGYKNDKYRFERQPKPVVAHEMGYFVTLPDLTQLPLFGKGLRPYWLYETLDLVAKKGLEKEYPAWLRNSYLLQAECLKVNMESARRSNLQGYSCWLFQDYPWCAEGVVDMYFRPKAFPGATFQQFNGATVVLLDRDQRTFATKDTLEMKLLVASEQPGWQGPIQLTWKIREGDGEGRVLASDTTSTSQGPELHPREWATVRWAVPDWSEPRVIHLEAEVSDATHRARNAWKLWVFPQPPSVPEKVELAADDSLRSLFPGAGQVAAAEGSTGGLRVTRAWDDATLKFLEAGGRVLLLGAEAVFPTVTSGFRPAGWDPSSREANLGTLFDPAHPAMRGMPSEGWCDFQFYSLVQGAQAIMLDEIPGELSPIVRCIDMPQRLWNKAFLFEARVGRGSLLVSGFNFAGALAAQDPAGRYFADQLIRYALSPDFAPKTELAAAQVQPRARAK